MKRMMLRKLILPIFLALTIMACSLFSKNAGKEKAVEPVGRSQTMIRQWASSAHASSEYDNPDWSAQQATGAPDTLECGDKPSAWASLGDVTIEWLEVRYNTPVTPTEINVYESHTPTQIVRVELLDTHGAYHEVYTAQPKITDCPYILSIPVQRADYQAVGVKVTVDQSQLGLPWDEIDALELVGYADTTVAGSGQETDANTDDQPAEVPDIPLVEDPLMELPIANPDQEQSFNLSYSGCNEDGQEQGTEIEASVHDDRIDLRLKGTNGKNTLITLPRNLDDNFSDKLVPFALEGRVPSSAGLYIRSVWWYGENGKVSTYYNSDGTLSGEVEFEGTRTSGCKFKVNVEFEHVVLRK